MPPSSTVENYLKAIYQAEMAHGDEGTLVPMGQLASALHVVPGTATTMVKALADSGLVRYEPYAGVRLTAAGRKLAALVLRRHRLMEGQHLETLFFNQDLPMVDAVVFAHHLPGQIQPSIDQGQNRLVGCILDHGGQDQQFLVQVFQVLLQVDGHVCPPCVGAFGLERAGMFVNRHPGESRFV